MKINFPVRWKESIELTEDERLTRRALDQDDQDDIVYTTGFITIESSNIRNWNGTDDGYTSIRTYDGDGYSILIPHEEFDDMWQNVVGETVVKIRIEEKRERKRRKVE